MTPRDESAALGQEAAQGMTYQRQCDSSLGADSPQSVEPRKLNPKSKRASVLRVFLERGSLGLTCFEAVRLAHDYVLRTTVSEITRFHGISFRKKYEQVPNFAGGKTDCVRYTLCGDDALKARTLLGAA